MPKVRQLFGEEINTEGVEAYRLIADGLICEIAITRTQEKDVNFAETLVCNMPKFRSISPRPTA